MRSVRLSQDFVPISELKARAAEWLRHVDETDAPVVVTQNGRPAGVLLSPRAYDELTERGRFLAAVNEGMSDALAGRVVSHAEVKRRMQGHLRGKAK